MRPSAICSLVVPWFVQVQSRFILSRGHSSTECLQLGACSPLSMRALPARISAHSRHHHTASTCARGSKSSLRSALRCSQPLGGLLRCVTHGPISSRSRAQGSSPFEGLSTQRSDRLSSSSSTPSPLAQAASPASEWPAIPNLDLEVFIHAGPRAVRLVFSRPSGRSLHRILAFPQVLSMSRKPIPRLPTLMAFVHLDLLARERARSSICRASSALPTSSLIVTVSAGDHLPELFCRRSAPPNCASRFGCGVLGIISRSSCVRPEGRSRSHLTSCRYSRRLRFLCLLEPLARISAAASSTVGAPRSSSGFGPTGCFSVQLNRSSALQRGTIRPTPRTPFIDHEDRLWESSVPGLRARAPLGRESREPRFSGRWAHVPGGTFT